MSGSRRRALPDNLDPLVDTLSNVVGILVIVIALTQLELGDALARVARAGDVPAAEVAPLPPAAEPPATEEGRASEARLARLSERGGDDPRAVVEALERLLPELGRSAAAEAGEKADEGAALSVSADRAALEARVVAAREAVERSRAAHVAREAHARSLVAVPERLVARVPDPQIIEGRVAWILVRYGRVYLVDREALFEAGQRAIRKILPDAADRALRADELASAALYLRKADVGLGPLRWVLEAGAPSSMRIEWRTRDGGLERSRIATDASFDAWLASRSSELDAIRFHVWNDSFETYLEARNKVEAAGFRAGWVGHEAAEELMVALRFGPALPEVRPLEID